MNKCTNYTSARGFIHLVDSTHVQSLAPIGVDFLHQIVIAIIDKLRCLSTYVILICELPVYKHISQIPDQVKHLDACPKCNDHR